MSGDPKALGDEPSTPTQLAPRVDAKNPATLTAEQQKQLDDMRKKVELARKQKTDTENQLAILREFATLAKTKVPTAEAEEQNLESRRKELEV